MAHITDDPKEPKELTDDEFNQKVKELTEAGYPDLIPCCKKERRNFNGWCISCGDPCY